MREGRSPRKSERLLFVGRERAEAVSGRNRPVHAPGDPLEVPAPGEVRDDLCGVRGRERGAEVPEGELAIPERSADPGVEPFDGHVVTINGYYYLDYSRSKGRCGRFIARAP